MKKLKSILTEGCKEKEVGPFRSSVGGEQNAKSDIDILVEFEEEADFFDLIGLSLYLEETFQRPVDTVSKRALRVEFQESVLHEVVVV